MYKKNSNLFTLCNRNGSFECFLAKRMLGSLGGKEIDLVKI